MNRSRVTPSVDVVVAVESLRSVGALRRSPWSRCPSPCRPAQKNPRPRAFGPSAPPGIGAGKTRTMGGERAGERIGRDARAKSPSTPPATRFVRFREQIPVAAQSAGPANARRPGAGSRPRRRREPGCRTRCTDLRSRREGPSATQEAEPSLRDRRARSWRRWSSSSNASASCGCGRSAPVPGRHRRLTTVPFGDHCKRGGRAEPLARDRIPAGAGSGRVSARQALIPTGRDEHDGKESNDREEDLRDSREEDEEHGDRGRRSTEGAGAPLGRGREGSADGVQRVGRRSRE